MCACVEHTENVDKRAVHDELDRVRAAFRALLDGAAPDASRRRSNGTRWTNRQLLFHTCCSAF